MSHKTTLEDRTKARRKFFVDVSADRYVHPMSCMYVQLATGALVRISVATRWRYDCYDRLLSCQCLQAETVTLPVKFGGRFNDVHLSSSNHLFHGATYFI